MTPLRKRMSEDLQLKGYSPKTQETYLDAVAKLARHYHKSPAMITEEELRAYFLHLTQVEHCAQGTLKIALAGIKFCLAVTLQRQWPVLGLIRAFKQKKLPVVLSRQEVRAVLACVRIPVYRVCLQTIYACGLRISEGTAVQVGDVDSQRKVLRVRGKGNKDRQVPLAEPTLESLRALWKLHRSEPWLFPARLQPRSAAEEGPVNRKNGDPRPPQSKHHGYLHSSDGGGARSGGGAAARLGTGPLSHSKSGLPSAGGGGHFPRRGT